MAPIDLGPTLNRGPLARRQAAYVSTLIIVCASIARHNSRHNLSETGGYGGARKWLNQAKSLPGETPYNDLITRRSRVRIPPPLLEKAPEIQGFFVEGVSRRRPCGHQSGINLLADLRRRPTRLRPRWRARRRHERSWSAKPCLQDLPLSRSTSPRTTSEVTANGEAKHLGRILRRVRLAGAGAGGHRRSGRPRRGLSDPLSGAYACRRPGSAEAA